MRNRLVIKALAVLAAGAFFWLRFAGSGEEGVQIHVLQGSTMGTTWSVQIATDAADQLPDTGSAVQALLHRLDREVFSTWTPDSELSRLNRSPSGVPQQISPEMLEALSLAQEIYQSSRYTFDISIGPLVNLWGFGPEPYAGVPEAAEIAAAQAQIGLEALQLDPNRRTVTFTKPLTLDLSSIAEGYAADAVAELLQAQGFDSFLVDVGGELRLQGLRPDGRNWTIAVESPRSGMREVYTRLDSRGEALAISGSGDYRNFREVDGKRYSHEIDPRTGAPVTHALASVTVIGDTAAAADAWSTALMVLGPEEGRAVADSEGLAAYFIMRGPAGLEHEHTAPFARYLQQKIEE